MAETFQVGDVVRLRAGDSPEMVIDRVMSAWEVDPVDIPSVRCVWINEQGQTQRECFNTRVLRLDTLFSIDLKMNEIFTEMSHPQSGDGPLADLEILRSYLAVQRGLHHP